MVVGTSYKKISKDYKRTGINPYIMSTISKESSKGLPDLTRWIFENELKTRLSVVREPTCSLNSDTEEQKQQYKILNEEMKAAFSYAFMELEDPSLSIPLQDGLDICELHFHKPVFGASCGIGNNYFVINQEGELSNCPLEVNDGIPTNDDLIQIGKNNFKYSPSDRRDKNDEDDCTNCQWFPVCEGGCSVTNKRVNGHPFTKSPLCAFYKYVIPRYIVFFGRKLLQKNIANRKNISDIIEA